METALKPRPSSARRRLWWGMGAVIAALLSVFATATPSQAATSFWFNQYDGLQPTIYQTNLLYAGPVLSATTPPPPAGVITTVYWLWKFIDPPPTGLIYQVYVCRGSGTLECLLVSPTSSVTTANGSTSAFSGKPANSTFTYYARINASTTYVLNPAKSASRESVQVNYNY
jgi:hypothetical protein